MEILLLVFFVAAVGLAFYAFLPEKSEKQPEILTGIIPQAPANQEFFVLRLEEQVNCLNAELEELRLEHQSVQNELQIANEIVSDLKEELSKLKEKETPNMDYGEQEKLRADIVKLKEELLIKNRQLEKSLSENIILTKELNENKVIRERQDALEQANKKNESDKVEEFTRENSDLLNKIKILETQITEHNKEIEQQRQIIQKHQQLGEQVSKKDFDELQNKINEEKAGLDKFKKENTELSERIKSFEDKSAGYEKKIKEQEVFLNQEKNKCDSCVSKKELDEVKKKLENAEQVLRIVHGAGPEERSDIGAGADNG